MMYKERKCRVCGCSWNNACPGGCYWVESDLCSQCAKEQPEPMKVEEAVARLEKQLNTPQFDAHAQQGEPVEVFQVEAVRALLDGYKAAVQPLYHGANFNTRIGALSLVDAERDRQDAKWGQQNHKPPIWVGILGEEYGEYCQAVNETVFDNGPTERAKGGSENMIRELTHVAAVAIAAIECLLRGPEPGGEVRT